MHSPHADGLAPLPIFSVQRTTSKVRGPRPRTGWLRMETPVREGGWSWTCRQADLSRSSTISSCSSSKSSLSNQSSFTSESESASSPCNYLTPSFPSHHDSPRRHATSRPYPQRRKPSGPRPPSWTHSPNTPVRPTLSVNTSLSLTIPIEHPILRLPSPDFPCISPTEPMTPALQLPPPIPFSPPDLLDWDVIFELLGVEK